MHELQTLLTSLVITSQVVGMLKDFAVPRASALHRIAKEEWGLWRRRRGLSANQAAWAVVRRDATVHAAVARLARSTGQEAPPKDKRPTKAQVPRSPTHPCQIRRLHTPELAARVELRR